MYGYEMITAERARQIKEEGYDHAHDRGHGAELAAAAECYWHHADQEEPPEGWPWAAEYWKPKDHLRNLVRAGALYSAAFADTEQRYPERERWLMLAGHIAFEIDQIGAVS